MNKLRTKQESAFLSKLTYELLKSISKPLLKFLTILQNCLSSSRKLKQVSPQLPSDLTRIKRQICRSLSSRDYTKFSTTYYDLVAFLRSIDELDVVQLQQLWEPIILTCFGHFKRFFVSFKMLEEILEGLYSEYTLGKDAEGNLCLVEIEIEGNSGGGSSSGRMCLEQRVREFCRYNNSWLKDIVQESRSAAASDSGGGSRTTTTGCHLTDMARVS